MPARSARPARSRATSPARSGSRVRPSRVSTWPIRVCSSKRRRRCAPPSAARRHCRSLPSSFRTDPMATKAKQKAATRPAAQAAKNGGVRTTIAVQGARVHNLKNISVEIPRNSLVVVTGLSGSGKSSLAFDTIYAEGQRRYMESLSSYAKRFVAQVAKPDVDFVFGLSPVISIEQKTVGSNPRSTVGTMTDIASYLNLLYATIGQGHCPRSGEPTPRRTSTQILEACLALPEGTEIELRAPVFPVYGEELDFVFTELRKKGVRRMIIDGKSVDLSDDLALEQSQVKAMDAVVDRLVVGRQHEKAIKAGIAAA